MHMQVRTIKNCHFFVGAFVENQRLKEVWTALIKQMNIIHAVWLVRAENEWSALIVSVTDYSKFSYLNISRIALAATKSSVCMKNQSHDVGRALEKCTQSLKLTSICSYWAKTG